MLSCVRGEDGVQGRERDDREGGWELRSVRLARGGRTPARTIAAGHRANPTSGHLSTLVSKWRSTLPSGMVTYP